MSHKGERPEREDGAPWVSWVTWGGAAGWMATGTVRARSAVFESRLLRVMSAQTGASLDTVHSCPGGVLSIGPLGFTCGNGAAQRLLAECLHEAPERFLRAMLRVMAREQIFPERSEPRFRGPTGPVPFSLLQAMLVGGPSGWAPEQKERSREWVQAVATLLSFDIWESPYVRTVRWYLEQPEALSGALREACGWPAHGTAGASAYSAERQAMWALGHSATLLGDQAVLAELEMLSQEPIAREFRWQETWTRCRAASPVLTEQIGREWRLGGSWLVDGTER